MVIRPARSGRSQLLRIAALSMRDLQRKAMRPLALAVLALLAGRIWRQRQWARGFCLMVVSAIHGIVLRPGLRDVRREVLTAKDGEDFCIWWLRDKAASGRVWILIPGGMSDGHDFYIHQFIASGATASDDVAVFHPPGQGGTQWKRRFGYAFTDCSYLHELVERLSAYSAVGVVGFSAGGLMAVRWAKEVSCQQCTAVVSVCGAENMLTHFDEMSKGVVRLDMYLALRFHAAMVVSGLQRRLGLSLLPWPPTWPGYIRPCTEACRAAEHGVWRPFEDIVSDEYAECADAPTKAPLLRVRGTHDPVVLDKSCMQTSEHTDLWKRPGSHCDLFYWRPQTGSEIRSWVVENERPPSTV